MGKCSKGAKCSYSHVLKDFPCKYYIAFGECEKGRSACHKNYCQRCDKYEPRAKVKHKNHKRDSLQKSRERMEYSY